MASSAFLLFSTNCIRSWKIFYDHEHNIIIRYIQFLPYPAHVIGLVDSIVPGAVLAEAEEYRVYGHLVHADEGVGYQVGEQDGHDYLRPEMLNFFVLLQTGVIFTTEATASSVIAYSEDVIWDDSSGNDNN